MRESTVVLAAGDFPRPGGEPRRILAAATRVVACDGAALAYRRRFGRWPDAIAGDLDSAGRLPPDAAARVFRDAGQDDNDLSKALRLCRRMGWKNPVVLGASGGREDHAVGNVFVALGHEVRVATETGDFLPVRGRLSFRTHPGAGISVFSSSPDAKMSSRGLAWPLDGVRFDTPWRGTLNRALGGTATVASDVPASVFVERCPVAVRAAVSLGSNLGDRRKNLRRALAMLSRLPGTRLLDASDVEETEPVEVPERYRDLEFLNQAAVFETTLDAFGFSRAMHGIEDRLGRVRTVRNGPRTIDLDLIVFGDVEIDTPELTLPHPRAADRSFVLRPLASLGVDIRSR